MTGTPVPANTSSANSANSAATSHAAPSDAPTTPHAAGRPVHIRMLEDDSYGPPTYGVGMPIVVYFSAKITEARDFAAATTVTIDGAVNHGYWYFEKSNEIAGYPLQASFVPYGAFAIDGNQTFWPANSSVALTMNTKGVSAGPGYAFDDSLSLHMNIGDAFVAHVDCAQGVEKMVITDDGKAWATFPVSCGEADHPTYTGVKVVMQKGEQDPATGRLRPDGTVIMRGPGYTAFVKWSARLTNSGEYVHDAPWNSEIGQRSTSHGCTNLTDADSIRYYQKAIVGDVVIHSNTGGPRMPSWDGYGVHNVPIGQLRSGGLVSTV